MLVLAFDKSPEQRNQEYDRKEGKKGPEGPESHENAYVETTVGAR